MAILTMGTDTIHSLAMRLRSIWRPSHFCSCSYNSASKAHNLPLKASRRGLRAFSLLAGSERNNRQIGKFYLKYRVDEQMRSEGLPWFSLTLYLLSSERFVLH